MKLSMTINYADDPRRSAQLVRDLESAGLDIVWVAEAYSFDAVSQVGYLAALTSRIQIGAGILNVYSRSPSLLAMTAAGCDHLSEGRFILGLGASGPQVIEGFHGVPFSQPRERIRETIEICRQVWKREQPLTYSGRVFTIPVPPGKGTGLGKPLKIINHPRRPQIPVYWAAVTDGSVEATAELADGWLPYAYIPEKADDVYGRALAAGSTKRSADLGPLDIVVARIVAVGDDLPVDTILDAARPSTALYVGGMGARGKNFYNDVMSRFGYAAEARLIQDLYLGGDKARAAAAVPREWLEKSSLVGPAGYVKERIAALSDAGVTTLSIHAAGPDLVRTVATMRELVDDVAAQPAQSAS
jgi:F420-dependent oxidoreductase-like protein